MGGRLSASNPIRGADGDGTLLPAGPVLVADQLPASNPVRKSALEYVHAYEAKYGKGSVSTFGAHAWDAGLLLQHAIPVALKKAQPGTPEFRAALRDALEGLHDIAGAHGIFNMSPNDHNGLDLNGCAVASDAYFPFADGLLEAVKV